MRAQVIIQAAMVRNGWNERSTVITVMTVVRLTYLYLGKHEFFFRHFTVKKTSLPLPAESSLAYIFSGLLMNIQYVCEDGLLIKSLFAPKFLVYRGKIN